jgi:S-adenosylmethionine:tRNA ribosyltransferase-isomerase
MSAATAITAASGRRLDFELDDAHEAHEPPEARGLRRDQVRLLVSDADAPPSHARFDELGAFLVPGDLLVVNTSATIPAAIEGTMPDGHPATIHLSGELPGGLWLVEIRRRSASGKATAPWRLTEPAELTLPDGGRLRLLAPFPGSWRLWLATLELPQPLLAFLRRRGRAISYGHVTHEWPITAYQTVFARTPGSAEMPSASRPFTHELVTELVTRGVEFAPVVLHTGVSSLEGGELPYPERYEVPAATARRITAVRGDGGRVVAVGTTAVRAVAAVTDDRGQVHAGAGWTDVVVSREHPVPSLDGLVTGWHEPESTHLMMLESFAGHDALDAAYRSALDGGYLWHEFGDSHLILVERAR